MIEGKTQPLQEKTTPLGSSSRLNRALFNPVQEGLDVSQSRQSILLSKFLLALTLLTLAGTFIPLIGGMISASDPLPRLMATSGAAFLTAYLLSRTRHYKVGAWITVVVLTLLPFALFYLRYDFAPEQIAGTFGWLILGVLFASIFLGLRGVMILSGVTVVLLVLLALVVPGIPINQVFVPLSTYFVVSALIAISIRNRDQLEKIRLADISEKNLELLALRNSLEVIVESRTADLQKRLLQIRTAAEISRTISAELDPDTLFERCVSLIHERFDLYYVGVFQIDETGKFAVLKAGSGEPGHIMVARGHRLAVGGTSMIGWATAHRKPRIALDVGEDAVHFDNPYLPATRSELALPLLSGDEIMGAMSIQSSEPLAFDEDDITLLQGIADSLATAIQTARLFQNLQESLSEIETLHSNYLSDAWSEESLTEGAYSYTIGNQISEITEEELASINVPLALREQVIGELNLELDKADWSAEEADFIEAVSTQAAIALENARLLEETRRRVQRERVLADIVSKLWGRTDVEGILQTGIQELGRLTNASEGIIQLELDNPEPQDKAGIE